MGVLLGNNNKVFGNFEALVFLSVAWLLIIITTPLLIQAEETSSSNPTSSSGEQLRQQQSLRQKPLVQLKHHRYKSYRGNITEHHSPTTNHIVNVIPDPEEEDIHQHHHHHYVVHEDESDQFHQTKSSRSGIQLQKSPPDLQFGLAFTVPFVSLSTEKLLHTVSGKNFDSVSSLLKLNFSGLLLAAVVGVVAVAGLFLPSVLGPLGFGSSGGGGGWGGLSTPWFDGGSAPHFTGEQYNDYGNGWGGGGKINAEAGISGWAKELIGGGAAGRRGGRGIDGMLFGLFNKLRVGVETCIVQKVCEEVASNNNNNSNNTRLTEMVDELTSNELVKDIPLVKVVHGVVKGTNGQVCGKIKKRDCGEGLIGGLTGGGGDGLEAMLEGVTKAWGFGGFSKKGKRNDGSSKDSKVKKKSE